MLQRNYGKAACGFYENWCNGVYVSWKRKPVCDTILYVDALRDVFLQLEVSSGVLRIIPLQNRHNSLIQT